MKIEGGGGSGISDLVILQAKQNAEKVAILSDARKSLTYEQLSTLLHEVSHSLRSFGIERSDCVAVVLENGPEMATAFLSIAASATCAPLNPAYRDEDFEFYLADLNAKAVIVPAGAKTVARDVATRLGLLIIELQFNTDYPAGKFSLSITNEQDVQPCRSPFDYNSDHDIALVLHTSGTTSRPKQVPLSHRNVCASAANIARVLQLTSNDRCLNVMPLFHIHGLIGGLLSSVYAGGSVVCSAGFHVDTFSELFDRFKPTWYSAVPTIHQSVLSLAADDERLAGSNCLRLIRSSSSALPPTVMQQLEETFGVPVVESYGMTEAAHQMASNPLPPAARKPGSVGIPGGPEMAIIDDDGNLLSAGESGEIVIRGENVTSGYANNEEANQAAFTDGWFRTGDRGRTDGEGYFHITGRIKEMINRGGENISPREIDEALLEHPAVAQAVAFAVPHPSLGEDIAAAVVKNEIEVSDQELREFAFSRLTDFKVPSSIIFVDKIPKGPTGKLQRIGLHEKLAENLRSEFTTPSTELEILLADLWESVLAHDGIGTHDNFFALGGDSLVAGRLLARINSRFEIELAISSLFRSPTIAGQSALIEAALLDQIESE